MGKVKKRGGFINKEVVLTCGVLIDTLKCGKAHGSGVNCPTDQCVMSHVISAGSIM